VTDVEATLSRYTKLPARVLDADTDAGLEAAAGNAYKVCAMHATHARYANRSAAACASSGAKAASRAPARAASTP
jgi:hypothetical protein